MFKWAHLVALLVICGAVSAQASSLKSSKWEDRVDAVRHLKAEDQATLAQVALTDPSETVRLTAAERITDQAVLAKLVIGDTSSYVRAAALPKVTDQALLAEIVLKGFADEARSSALHAITDQAILAAMALDEREWYQSDVYLPGIVAKLTDQALLAQIALSDRDKWARAAAVDNLTDQELLASIAFGQDDDDFLLRLHAVPRLTDPAVLARAALECREFQVRARAVERLDDQETLAQVAARDEEAEVRDLASGRLTEAGRLRLGQLEFAQVRDSGDRDELRAFLRRFPAAPEAAEARARLGKVLHAAAVADGGCAACVEYLAECPGDPGAREMRRRLAARGPWEKAECLGRLAIAMIPVGQIDAQGQLVSANAAPLASVVAQYRVLLAAGADPAAVRIADATPQVATGDGRWSTTFTGTGLHSVNGDGSLGTSAFLQDAPPPRPEHAVPAAEGGLTLAEYATANEGAWLLAQAFADAAPDYPALALEAQRLLKGDGR